MKIYDFIVKDIQDEDFSLSEYKGKVLLVINGATGCGFTPQYDGLQGLYEKYSPDGFEILDFPSNQFLEQAPGTNEEIVGFCKLSFGVEFKQFAKIKVNGENEEPLYKYLKSTVDETKNDGTDKFYQKVKGYTPGIAEKDIRWNFTKFLIDSKGTVVARFAPTVTPEEIEKYVIELLQQNNDENNTETVCSSDFSKGCI
ncbi:glutathione peroxidase [Sedimentibacter acidaminivorans]|jgi:glutathione peroxidase|uniref:Glutathione peroxidase n=1 Tax=Sedimentibacter acidaminivorans TaxID=913099 RepID=A0ABS4GBL9_9FIRM|nr:glutathione peroxidase [Sedimentibacter acidaminivorans]MBP1925075.1 glutathione peroxidase [Sedimentibacter acidaminivorans]